MSSETIHDINAIGEHFSIYGDFVVAEPYGSGHINDTYAATYNQAGKEVRYIFQRINQNVFKEPILLMKNVQLVTEQQRRNLQLEKVKNASRRCLTLVYTKDQQPYFQDSEGNVWRVYYFIEDAKTYDVVESPDQAYQAAKAFGAFQKMLLDLDAKDFNETIPNFHNTPKRYQDLLEAIKLDSHGRAKDCKNEIDFAIKRKNVAETLIQLNDLGEIPTRITHNDTKLNNVMLDDISREGLCVIDLDTVMPGLALYDFGDLVRTSTSPAAEDERNLDLVYMQMHMFEALAKGYLEEMKGFLTQAEIDHLAFSGKLISFEIGLRFLTDYLSGDTYFRTHREGHNLDRCRTQFKLVESIESQEGEMNSLVKKLSDR